MSQAVETLEIQIKASSKDLKSSINAAKREFSALDNQANISVSANTADAEAALKSVEKQTKGLPDGDVDVTGDTSDAVAALDSLESQTKDLPDGSIKVAGDATDAKGKLDAVEEQTKGLPDGDIDVTANTSEAEGNLSRLEEKGKSVVSVLKAAGLVVFGKKAMDFAMESVDAASDAAETENKVNQLFWDSAAAREEIYRYTAGLHEEFGLNQTGLLDMTGSFAGAFKEAYGAEQAAEYAERLTNAAIDYASVLNKTPGEIGDIFMSMLKGNTAVADSAYIFGYTIESLNDTIAAMEQAGTDLPKGWGSLNDKQKQMYAMLLKVEENAQAQGFTGDFLRNKNSYAVQTTLLEEQWKTTEELAGKYLLPAKRKIVGGINAILEAVNQYAEGMGKSTFAKDTEGYFGNMELTEVDISNIVSIITAPVSQITDAVDGLKKKLGQAEKDLRTAYSDFEKALFMQEEGVGDAADTVAAAEKMGEKTIAKNEAEAHTLGEAFVAFVGTDEAWAEARRIAFEAIDGYYDDLNKKVEERTEALTQALKDGNIELAQELAQQQMEAAYEQTKYDVEAKQMLALKAEAESIDWSKEGVLSAESVEKLVKAATEATSEERAQLKAVKDETLAGVVAKVLRQADQAGKSKEEKDADAETVISATEAGYNADLAEMDANMRAKVWDVVMANGMDQLLQNAKEEVLSGTTTEYNYGKASRQLFSFFDDISSVEGFEDTMPDEMMQMYAVYDHFKRNFGNPYDENYRRDAEYIGQTAGNEHIKRAYEVDKDWFDDVFVRGLSAAEANLIHYGTEKDNTGDIGLSHAQIEGYQDLAAAERENNAQTAQALLNQMEASEALYSMLSGGTRDQLFDYIEDAAGQSADRTMQLLDAVLSDMEQYIDQATPEDAIFSWMRNFEETESKGNEYGEAGSIIEDAADKIKGVASEYKAALASLPERIRVSVNMHVGKYALGKAMNEAAGVYASIG